jgi:DNA-binding MarR family transcriptional regulator
MGSLKRKAQLRKPDQGRTVWLAGDDLSAARRVLAALGADTRHSPGPNAEVAALDRQALLEQARLSLDARFRRTEILGTLFFAEPPFALLLALYVWEDRETVFTITRLGKLAGVHGSTALRWLDELVGDGWVARANVPDDRRKARVSLTDKGRQGLDELFRRLCLPQLPRSE